MWVRHCLAMPVFLIVAVLLAAFSVTRAAGQEGSAEAEDNGPVAGLTHYFEAVETLAGAFRQTTRDETGEVIEEASGHFVIARPQRFVWDYRTPWEQLIVSDGEKLWVHDVALEQVVVRPLEEALGVGAAQLLSGDLSRLEENFSLTAGGEDVVILRPTDPAWDFQRVQLELEEGIPVSITVEDGLGQRVEVVLRDLTLNPDLSPGRFQFEPPAGADVMQGS
ncbi:outer membrane lipoprotein chaperone LolA [Spiribacter onubensis]|uniref:Outer-membrane lipoprotein carrier protein n=1 Tax=Spiribacter onubensis TaxID=3122420 RepID=A0ABV3S6I1_9GAMM